MSGLQILVTSAKRGLVEIVTQSAQDPHCRAKGVSWLKMHCALRKIRVQLRSGGQDWVELKNGIKIKARKGKHHLLKNGWFKACCHTIGEWWRFIAKKLGMNGYFKKIDHSNLTKIEANFDDTVTNNSNLSVNLPDKKEQVLETIKSPTQATLGLNTRVLTKEEKTKINTFVDNYIQMVPENWRTKAGRRAHFVSPLIIASIIYFTNMVSSVIAFTPFLVAETLIDHRIHQVALKKSKHLVRKMVRAGITDSKQLEYGVELYLKKMGSIIHSNFTILFNSNKIKKLAAGENIPVGKNLAYLIDQDYFYKVKNGDGKLKTIKRIFKKLTSSKTK